MKTAVAIRHVAFEGLGSLEPILRECGYAVQYCDIGVDELRKVKPLKADLVIILGGPIGAYEDDKYPFLADEFYFLEQGLAAKWPTLGICLGAQLIARALGGRVYPGPAKEIGWAPVTLTEEGLHSPVGHLGQNGLVLHWHGDTFDLPSGAQLLASTHLVPNQAYAIGSNILAFQFHPEVLANDIERWLIGHACELAVAGIDLASLRADAARFGADLENRARLLFREWIGRLDTF